MNNSVTDATKKILIVDDTPRNIDLLREILRVEGYSIAFATSGVMALETVERVEPDLILLDVMMPELDGFETCRRLKQMEKISTVPIIFVTAKTDPDDLAMAFEAGAVDYIIKPIRQVEVKARVRTHLRLRALTQELERLATTDDLTKLYNRRYLRERLQEEMHRATRSESPLSLIMLDIDFFKSINDTYGHIVGDEVLQKIAENISSMARVTDFCARYGGEEFCLVLPDTDAPGAQEISERIRQDVSRCEHTGTNGVTFSVTISLGVAQWDRSQTMLEFTSEADKALYQAKQSGRNRVNVA